MHINVVSSCEDFETDAQDDYSVSLNINLNENTTAINLSATVPTEENRIEACNNAADKLSKYKIVVLVSGILDALLVIILLIFILCTHDDNIDYETKVNRVLRNYKSYIQKVNNQVQAQGYQVLRVDTINELLEIRDTLQKPILFTENEDKTTSKFFILTEQIMYVFKIEVFGYEEDDEVKNDTLNTTENHKNYDVEESVKDVCQNEKTEKRSENKNSDQLNK